MRIGIVTLTLTLAAGVSLLAQSGSAARLSGSVMDPAGDSRGNAQVPTPPDFVSATLEVTGQNLTITVSFARGTWTTSSGLRVYLDTDENVMTGVRMFARERDTAIGADYRIGGVQPHDPARVALTRISGASTTFVASLPLEVSGDQVRIVVPLAQLGNDDGRLVFKMECYQVISSSTQGRASTQATLQNPDVMPNSGSPAGVVR